jgi:hypothetical protein
VQVERGGDHLVRPQVARPVAVELHAVGVWVLAAQGQKTLLAAPELSLSAEALLKGLARCAGCRHTLKISGSFDKSFGRCVANYYCVGRYAKGLCPARASIRADKLDGYVERRILAALEEEGGLLAQAVEASEQIEQAAQAVAEAEHELDLYLTSELLRSQSTLAEELASGDVLTAWPELDVQERRQLLHGLLDGVLVKRSDGRKRDALPLAERTQIVLRGNVLPEAPTSAVGLEA